MTYCLIRDSVVRKKYLTCLENKNEKENALKAAIVNDNLEILHEVSVIFEIDLPEFRTQSGTIKDEFNPNHITAPVIMWVKALDIVMDRLVLPGADFSHVAAISGSAQQHGSVYWKKGVGETLENLDPGQSLHEQLSYCFSITNSPIWMDSSTTKQCKKLDEAVGGPENAANSAMLGSAINAKHGLIGAKYEKIIASLDKPQKVCDPCSHSDEIYPSMTARYREIVRELLAEQHNMQ